MHHDMDDAIRTGLLRENDVPREINEVLGKTCGKRLDFLIHDLVSNSYDQNDIRLSEETDAAMKQLRACMFERVYQNPDAKKEEEKAETLVKTLYWHYFQHPELIPADIRKLMERGDSREQVVCDYLSTMTDRYAIAQYEAFFVPQPWID
jgi:dGTPase